MFIKNSILILYSRIFTTSWTFTRWLWLAGGMTLFWGLSSFLVLIFQCHPIQAAWDHSVHDAKCLDWGIVTLAYGISNIVLDFTLLVLPMPLQNHMNRAEHSGWLTHSSACVVSIARLFFTKVGF